MGNAQKKSNPRDLGSIVSTDYPDNIPFRNTLVNSYRIEQPIWIECKEYSVTKAFHIKLKKDIVLKKIMISEESTKELINMLAICKNLSHMNIRNVSEVFQTKSHYYLVFEYINGLHLNDFLIQKASVIKILHIKKIFKEILLTLNFVHKNNIILRNFDPSNILIDGENVTLIGLSKARLMNSSNKNVKKNFKYMENFTNLFYKAPEVLDQDYDQRADIWTLGIMLHQAITGSLPFVSTRQDDLIKKIRNEAVNTGPLEKKKIDPNLVKLILSMLEKDPNKRPTIDFILSDPWFNVENQKADEELLKNITPIGKIDKTFTIVDYLKEFISKRSHLDNETKNLRNLFKKIDKNNDGVVTKDEMLYAVESSELVMSEADIKIIFSKYDRNKSGVLEFDEFMTAFMEKSSVKNEQKIMELFEFLDTDQTGYLEYEEILKTIGSNLEAGIDRTILNKFAKTDKRFNRKEFVQMINFLIEHQLEREKNVNKTNQSIQRSKTKNPSSSNLKTIPKSRKSTYSKEY